MPSMHHSITADILNQAHEELIARLGYIQVQPKRVLLLGEFSAGEVQKIAKIYRKAQIYQALTLTDLPTQDLAKRSFEVILGAEIHPEKAIFEEIFQGFAQLLNSDGMLLFTILGPDWDKNNDKNYPDMHDIGDLLLQLGFENPVVDSEFGLTFGHAWGPKLPKQIQEKNPDGSLKAIRVSLDQLIASLKKPFQR
jgi:hypothetical protein